jgi:transcriptional regulator with XRE-family HTH domain
MQKSNTINEAFRKELKRALRDQHLTVDAAAIKLKITRQAFHNYLNGTSMPRPTRLANAVRILKLKLTIGDETFDASAFPESPSKPQALPKQPTLWEALDNIADENLTIKVKRVGRALRVAVSIDIPA